MFVKSTASLAVVGMTVALAACGSSDKAPSKADYIAKADKICKTEGAKVDKLSAKLTSQSPVADFAAFKQTAVPALESELKQIRDLKMPDGESATLNGIYDEVEAITKTLKATPPAGLSAFFQTDPFAAVNKTSIAYGFKECGK